jgi:hypothetical protein
MGGMGLAEFLNVEGGNVEHVIANINSFSLVEVGAEVE